MARKSRQEYGTLYRTNVFDLLMFPLANLSIIYKFSEIVLPKCLPHKPLQFSNLYLVKVPAGTYCSFAQRVEIHRLITKIPPQIKHHLKFLHFERRLPTWKLRLQYKVYMYSILNFLRAFDWRQAIRFPT